MQIHSYFKNVGYSSFNFSEGGFTDKLLRNQILIVDRIGILMNLYSYGDIAYVGGSFGTGVHNVMEPAAFHLPILFGTKILNSPEALELIRREAGFKVENSDDVWNITNNLCENKEYRISAGHSSGKLVEENLGATEKIVLKILSTLS